MKPVSTPRSVLWGLILLHLVTAAHGQLVIGQYEDEAPFRTWNTLGIITASSSGTGEARFALAGDASAALANPALLPSLSPVTFAVSGSYSTASFHRYSLVNTGVLHTSSNSTMGLYTVDFAGLSFTFRGWSLSVSMGLLETYDRPSQEPEISFQGRTYYRMEFSQDGQLRNINFSLARKVTRWLSLGLGVNFVSGNMEKRTAEKYLFDDITITDLKSHDLRGIYLNGGLLFTIGQKLSIGAVFRSPYSRKAESRSRFLFSSPRGNTEIHLEAAGESVYAQPLVLGLGVAWKFNETLRAAADACGFLWSSYTADLLGGQLQREFRDVVKLSGGVEYTGHLELFGTRLVTPLRAGCLYDPQPMREPRPGYLNFTVGSGIHWEMLHLDIGVLFGKERGSGHDLRGKRMTLTLSFHL